MGSLKEKNIQTVVDYCRQKSITPEDLQKYIAGNSSDVKAADQVEKVKSTETTEKEVTEILKNFGIPAHIKGYQYVRYAIMRAKEDQDALERVTKVLYPEVAKKFKTTSSRAERAIRHAIEIAWERGDESKFEEYFGNTIDPRKGKPTNSEFIAMIVDHLRLN